MIPEISLSVCRDVRGMPSLTHTSRNDDAAKALREMVIGQGRFGRRCYYCDFSFGSSDLFEVHNTDHDHRNQSPENLVPICEMCHASFHIDLVGRKWAGDSGRIIFLPELTQPELNNLLQAVFYAEAVHEAGEKNENEGKPIIRPEIIYNRLHMRRELTEQNRAGLSEPYALSRVLADMDEATYANRDEILFGLRYLAPRQHFKERAKSWGGDDNAFSKLDMAAWAGIAG